MFSKSIIKCLTAVFFLLSAISSAQENSLILFEDGFESFIAGQQLVCQDSINWDTWNSIPCDSTTDPYITNAIAFSGSKSVWIQQDNDLIKPIPNYTTGKYSIGFHLYIPEGYTASWGQLAAFYNPDSTEWAFTAKFDPLGNGYISGGGSGAPFSFSYDTWMHNKLIVDLNNDSAVYYFEGNLIHEWQWTLAIWGDTCAHRLSVTDIMGSDWPNPDSSQWYIDDYVVERLDTMVGVKDFSLPAAFILNQNYPNPFNPTTTIKYQIPELSFVTLIVYDILGRVAAALVNQVKTGGSYEIEFDGSALTSGIYFYQLKAGKHVQTRKMALLR